MNEAFRIARPYQLKRWIACVTEWRGRRRAVMQPRTWTELFFLDEASAFAAGHRPCAYCRRADYDRFRATWSAVVERDAGADAIDARLHAERLTEGRAKRTSSREAAALPDGAFVALDGAAWLVAGARLLRWSDGGYDLSRPLPEGALEVLTPPSLLAVFAAGYRPALHASAASWLATS